MTDMLLLCLSLVTRPVIDELTALPCGTLDRHAASRFFWWTVAYTASFRARTTTASSVWTRLRQNRRQAQEIAGGAWCFRRWESRISRDISHQKGALTIRSLLSCFGPALLTQGNDTPPCRVQLRTLGDESSKFCVGMCGSSCG